jgi:hypothetical protein
MKKYLGIKVIEAEPMNEQTAIKIGLARENKDNHELREGYHVIYKDGYQSWSPKATFDEAYRPFDNHVDEMRVELAYYEKKYNGLQGFIGSELFDVRIPDNEQKSLVYTQLNQMKELINTLKKRINYFEGNGKD